MAVIPIRLREDPVRLNEYISHYETLNYDHQHIRASHHRARRSVTKDHYVHLKFQAHGRDFHLRLKRDLYTFSDKLEIIDNNNGPLDVATDHIYDGQVIGDRNSYVFGSILDGVFEVIAPGNGKSEIYLRSSNEWSPNIEDKGNHCYLSGSFKMTADCLNSGESFQYRHQKKRTPKRTEKRVIWKVTR
uniref:Peptidase M12B propeptide domain-containing protein n=1 Tax=Glossina austeni TaxID=7395 RepID=A0A1A9V163_GLOAU